MQRDLVVMKMFNFPNGIFSSLTSFKILPRKNIKQRHGNPHELFIFISRNSFLNFNTTRKVEFLLNFQLNYTSEELLTLHEPFSWEISEEQKRLKMSKIALKSKKKHFEDKNKQNAENIAAGKSAFYF